jgi:hypothetical protein
MKIILTIWQAQLKSLYNAARHDQRMQIALAIGLAFTFIFAIWSANQLSQHLHWWQLQGPGAVDAGLWSLCLLTWSGMSTITILTSTMRTLSDEESLVLFFLPIPPATRFRALLGSFFIGNLWNWLLLELGVTGYIFVSVLGWHALVWLLVLQLGVGISVLCTLISTLLVIRYLIPNERLKTGLVIAIALGTAVSLIATSLLTLQHISKTPVPSPKPEIIIVLFVIFLIAALGPGANSFGTLYEAAFQTMQSWDRSRRAATIPGIRSLTRVLARQRTLTGALFVKMLLSQSRNVLAWLRIGVVLIVLAFFPQLHTLAAHYGWPDTLYVVGLAAGLALVSVVEQAPSAISGEANRLLLYLTAPVKWASFLRAKLLLFTLPILIEGIAIGLFLDWHFELSPAQSAFALAEIILIVVGILAVFVLGSAWDEDLNQAVEGAMQTLLQEEVLIAPRRIWLFNLGIATFLGMLLLLWKLPPMLSQAALVLLDTTILAIMWQFGLAQLRRLVRNGVSFTHQGTE